MDVVGAAHVETGKDGLKVHRAIGPRHLNSTQEGQFVGGTILPAAAPSFARRRRPSWAHRILLSEAGIEADRVTVPYIHGGVGQGFTR